MTAPVLEPLAEDEVDAYVHGAVLALRIDDAAQFTDFVRLAGVERFRVVRAGSRLVAGGGWIGSAHHVGGRPVDAGLVTAVWTAPHVRGRGMASALMAGLLAELRRDGVPLSSLAPANLPLYRRAGYEVGVLNHHHRLPTRAFTARAPEGWTVEPLDGVGPTSPGPLAWVYARSVARLGAAATRRVPALWYPMFHWTEGGETLASVVRDPAGNVRGSVILDTHHAFDAVNVRDWHAFEADAARTLLAYVAGFRGIFEEVKWTGPAADPSRPTCVTPPRAACIP
jgi:predicted acetyltransferase